LLENLFSLAEPDKPYMVQIAATKEIFDRLIGKPQVTIEATTTKLDIGAMYLSAMKRANAEMASPTEGRTIEGDETCLEKSYSLPKSQEDAPPEA
jgi:hypothetical protein